MSWPKIWQSGPGNCGKFFGQFEIFIFVEEIDCRFKRNHNRCAGRQMIQTLVSSGGSKGAPVRPKIYSDSISCSFLGIFFQNCMLVP